MFLVARGYNQSYTLSMKTAISIPDHLFEAAETAAQKLGVSRSHLFRLALADYLRRQGHAAVTEALDSVYGKPGVSTGLDPALAWLQEASLVQDKEGEDW